MLFKTAIPLLATFLFMSLSAAQSAGPKPLVIAHRGDSQNAPENTLSAIEMAAEKGADLIEFDVRATRDGKLVLFHDKTMERTSTASGKVEETDFADLANVDTGAWFSEAYKGEPLPTMKQAIKAALPGATPLIERKSGSAAAYIKELERMGVIGEVQLQAFDWDFLAEARRLNKDIKLGALGDGDLGPAQIGEIKAAGADFVGWRLADVTQHERELTRDHGLGLYVWTVNGPPMIRRMIEMGVDGIITDQPAIALKLRGQGDKASEMNFEKNLAHYWSLNSSTDLLRDAVGGTKLVFEGTTSNERSFQLEPFAKFGGAVFLRGRNEALSVPSLEEMEVEADSLTLSLWFNPSVLPSKLDDPYASLFDSKEDAYALYLDKEAKELRFKITLTNGEVARLGAPESMLRRGGWQHVVAVYESLPEFDSGYAALYLDGDLVGSASPRGFTGHVKAGQKAAIGRNGVEEQYFFRGGIDDVAIWNRALTADEVNHLYTVGRQGTHLGRILAEESE